MTKHNVGFLVGFSVLDNAGAENIAVKLKQVFLMSVLRELSVSY